MRHWSWFVIGVMDICIGVAIGPVWGLVAAFYGAMLIARGTWNVSRG